MLHPSKGALEFESWVEGRIGKDIALGGKDWTEWNGGSWGIFEEGAIESKLCDKWYGKTSSDVFISESPNHYLGGDDLPSMSSIIVVNGVRTEYKGSGDMWKDSKCSPAPKWFPLQGEETKPLGYLYKIHWYIKHPYSQSQLDAMTEGKRRDLGLEEHGGNITYRIVLEGTACSSEDLPAKYEMPSPRYYELAPGQTHDLNFAYYDMAYMDKIKIVFEDYKYNTRDNVYESKTGIVAVENNAPQSFGFFPEETVGVGTTPQGNVETTNLQGGSSSSSSSRVRGNCPANMPCG